MDKIECQRKRRFWDLCQSFVKEYFPHEERQKIKNYLEKKSLYENLDIGGGSENYVENSCILDFSILSLKKNKETRKVLFDLDYISKSCLPLKDNSFSSATLVGVWPYLIHPAKVLKDLERVVKPKGKIYIITNNKKKIRKIKRGPNDSKSIERVLSRMGCNFKVEDIFKREIESIEISLN